jgi:FkbM family methyltransferase
VPIMPTRVARSPVRAAVGRLVRRCLRRLDTPRGRPIVGHVLEQTIRVVHGEQVTVRYAPDGYWVLDWPTASVPMPEPWHSPSPAEYEELARDVFLQEYTPAAGDVVVDVGAGTGWELGLFSRLVGPAGHVYAIEADPETFRYLQRRQQLNRLANVTAIQVALADAPGEVTISEEGFHETHHLVPDGRGRTVPALTVDELVAWLGIVRIDFLKMNIEGAERVALAGMDRSAERVQNIAVSCHDYLADRGGSDATRTRAFVLDFLVAHGFEVVERRGDDERDWARSYLYARRPPAPSGAAPPWAARPPARSPAADSRAARAG